MHDHVTDHALVDLGVELLRIPSFKGQESQLARWLAGYFEQRGYTVDLQEITPGRFQTIARLPGRGTGPSLMLNGHLDIDPLRAGWTRDPFAPVAADGLLYGAGARNMKAGLTSMIIAAESIRRSGEHLDGDLVLACVAGELQGGVGTTSALRNGLTADAAVVPEPFGADHLVTTTCGVLELAISTRGFSEHISRKEGAVDALQMMIPVIQALDRIEFTHRPHPALPDLPRLVVGGVIAGRGANHDMTGPNYTPDHCTITVDVRYVPGQSKDSVVADIRRAVENVRPQQPDLDYEITFDSAPPYVLNQVVFEPSEVPTSEPIVTVLAAAHQRVTGEPPAATGAVLPHSYCGADSAHLWGAGIPSVLYGPTGPARTAAEPDDCAFLEEMETVAHVLVDSAVQFCSNS